MAAAKQGDTVKVHYTGKLNDGTIFDSSDGGDPLEFTLGSKMVIPGFEVAVEGMGAGDDKTVTIPSDEAYGPRHDDMILEVDKGQLPQDMEPEVGQELVLSQDDGNIIQVIIAEIGDASVKLDANHPLAGQDLTFDIKLVEIV